MTQTIIPNSSSNLSPVTLEVLWVEKYRPQTVQECILPERLTNLFSSIVDNEVIPNLLLVGRAGVGKTTIAKALCKMLDIDFLFINASEDGNIDTLRNKIRQFASTNSLSGGRKMVILDEADHLNPSSTQPALRGFMEEFSSNCGFILTCNFLNKIIQPLHSRCTVIDFKLSKQEKVEMMIAAHGRICNILESEGINADPDVLNTILLKWFPDMRRILNELQRYSASGRIDDGILINLNESNMLALVKAMKDKKFNDVRKWVVDNLDNDSTSLFRQMYDAFAANLQEQSIPLAVLIIADYMYKAAFCTDQEINTVACLTQLMMECEFKK